MPPKRRGPCTAPGCSRQHYSKGYCKRHYTQVLRHGRLTPEREQGAVRQCQAPDCDRADTRTNDYCRKHRRQIQKHGRLMPEREHQMGNVGCRVVGCQRMHRAKGLCGHHYNRVRGLQQRIGLSFEEAILLAGRQDRA